MYFKPSYSVLNYLRYSWYAGYLTKQPGSSINPRIRSAGCFSIHKFFFWSFSEHVYSDQLANSLRNQFLGYTGKYSSRLQPDVHLPTMTGQLGSIAFSRADFQLVHLLFRLLPLQQPLEWTMDQIKERLIEEVCKYWSLQLWSSEKLLFNIY